ncbi:MAG: 2Fe-2S iron-sulfur cluster-binding protein [Vulcanimicrobiota bacterium]
MPPISKEVMVEFQPRGLRDRVPVGVTLLEAAGLVGQELRHVCGGNANCTTCRVQVVRGADFLSPPEGREAKRLPAMRLEQGWRLSCQTRVKGPVAVRVPSIGEWIELNNQEVHPE